MGMRLGDTCISLRHPDKLSQLQQLHRFYYMSESWQSISQAQRKWYTWCFTHSWRWNSYTPLESMLWCYNLSTSVQTSKWHTPVLHCKWLHPMHSDNPSGFLSVWKKNLFHHGAMSFFSKIKILASTEPFINLNHQIKAFVWSKIDMKIQLYR